MKRVLLVLRGPIEPDALVRLFADVTDQSDVALCYEASSDIEGEFEPLRLQRDITFHLRRLLGGRAETVPIFVAMNVDGERVSDYAAAWQGADAESSVLPNRPVPS